jgi:hypothetical protein
MLRRPKHSKNEVVAPKEEEEEEEEEEGGGGRGGGKEVKGGGEEEVEKEELFVESHDQLASYITNMSENKHIRNSGTRTRTRRRG